MVDDPLLTEAASTREAESQRAQTELYATNHLGLRRAAFLLTGSVAVAEELVHDAFEQVVRRWGAIEHPSAYLRVAVLNGARSWGRKEHRMRPNPPVEYAALDEEAIAVREALATLRHDEREVVVLRYFVGLTDSQIAAELDRPLGTVKSQIHRALAHMRKALS